MTHVYFAHAITDYDTDYEQQCINLIKENFPECKIHNPKELSKLINKNLPEQGRFKAYFFPEILKCDTLIAAPVFNHKRKGEFMSGTMNEIIFAYEHKKCVFEIRNNKINKIQFILTDDEHLCPNHSVIPQC